jgi:myo-inositol-1(or 4)-monophosphatase
VINSEFKEGELNMLPTEFIELNTAIKESGKILMRYFGQQLQLSYKSTSADYRTQADVDTEKAIIGAIERIFPTYNIIAEECGEIQKDSAFTFIIDPLDGTNNFVLGIPAFTSSVALMRGKEIIYGVIHYPITGDIYYAMKGKGAFFNGVPITVNSQQSIQNVTISYYCNYVTSRQHVSSIKNKISKLEIRRCLDLWAPAFCYCGLASGRIEAIINDGIELYDFAAGKLIAAEAGAKITDFNGNVIADDTDDTFVVTNGTEIHSVLVDSVTKD